MAYGWDFDNVILLELPDYGTIDKLEGDERSRAIGHRAGEWMFERHHAMFLRERMGTDLEYTREHCRRPGLTQTRIATTHQRQGGRSTMANMTSALGEIAADASLERTTFLAQPAIS